MEAISGTAAAAKSPDALSGHQTRSIGSIDQQNAARCVIQLSTEGPSPDGTTTIAAERHKDNLGFKFTKLVLVRDPKTRGPAR